MSTCTDLEDLEDLENLEEQEPRFVALLLDLLEFVSRAASFVSAIVRSMGNVLTINI